MLSEHLYINTTGIKDKEVVAALDEVVSHINDILEHINKEHGQ